jgi:Fur family zinc uptake transcriptional regulator
MAATISRAQQIQEAEAACLRRGAKLTPLRREVLELVLESDAPIGAYALLDRLKAARPGAAPPTVYRALDFLLEHGLIHKVERLNAFIGCTEAGHAHDHHHPHQFLICRRCGTTVEIADDTVAHAIADAARRAGFTAAEATVEIEGTCGRCAGA